MASLEALEALREEATILSIVSLHIPAKVGLHATIRV
jgi:hypothetical protein